MAADGTNGWVERAARIAHDVLARHSEDVDSAGRWPAESVQALADAGLLGLTVPTEFGGGGEGPIVFAEVMSALATHCASTAMIYLMHICATQVITAAEDFGDREDVLRSIVAGRHLTTLAFSEKGSRSHFWAPVSQAVVRGANRQLSAEKSWVTSAGHADSYIVSTRAAGLSESTASTLYYVPKDVSGIAVGGTWNGMGMRGNASAPMRLDNVLVPDSHRLSGDGDGFSVMINVVLPWFQLGNAAVSLGIARAATASTQQHLLSSRLAHLDQPLAEFMNLRARLAQMHIATDMLQAFLRDVAHQMAHPGPNTMLAVVESKAAAAETALRVTDLAMQTCGGAAFSRHVSVERNFRDARAAWVMAPTTDVLYDFVAKSLLDMPLF